MKPRSSKTRRLTRPHTRRLTRSHWRPRGGFAGEPNHLTAMLAANRNAIRAYRRLAKLAPSHFDPAVMDREAREREEQRRWSARIEEALETVYGPRTPEQREADRQADLLAAQPPRLHPNTQRAVNRERACYEFWKVTGRLAWDRYKDFSRRRPHDIPTLGQVARMVELAMDFGWIATGRDWRNPQPDPPPTQSLEDQIEADIRRAYGTPDHLCALDPSATNSVTKW